MPIKTAVATAEEPPEKKPDAEARFKLALIEKELEGLEASLTFLANKAERTRAAVIDLDESWAD